MDANLEDSAASREGSGLPTLPAAGAAAHSLDRAPAMAPRPFLRGDPRTAPSAPPVYPRSGHPSALTAPPPAPVATHAAAAPQPLLQAAPQPQLHVPPQPQFPVAPEPAPPAPAVGTGAQQVEVFAAYTELQRMHAGDQKEGRVRQLAVVNASCEAELLDKTIVWFGSMGFPTWCVIERK